MKRCVQWIFMICVIVSPNSAICGAAEKLGLLAKIKTYWNQGEFSIKKKYPDHYDWVLNSWVLTGVRNKWTSIQNSSGFWNTLVSFFSYDKPDPGILLGPEDAKMTVILIHGFASSAEYMASVADYLLSSGLTGVRFWCPNGPEQHIHARRQWFSLHSVYTDDLDNIYSIRDPNKMWEKIKPLLTAAAKKFRTDYKHIWDGLKGGVVVAGHSQGGMMAYELGLFGSNQIKGVAALSSAYYLDKEPTNRPKLFWAHAENDPIVEYFYRVKSDESLAAKRLYSEIVLTKGGWHEITVPALIEFRHFLEGLRDQDAKKAFLKPVKSS